MDASNSGLNFATPLLTTLSTTLSYISKADNSLRDFDIQFKRDKKYCILSTTSYTIYVRDYKTMLNTINKLLGDPNEKHLKKLQPLVQQVRAAQKSDAFKPLTKEDLPKETQKLKERLKKGESTDDILPEAFGLVCRACELLQGESMNIGKETRTWDMVPYDVQIIGGIVLHQGGIAEMKTGEGKTLSCTMPVYLNALVGKGVHVITVNDYLAARDAQWMGMLYTALGLTVGSVVHGIDNEGRKKAYGCDVTYGTNNEFGFDYLRDNMAQSLDQQVQRGDREGEPHGLHYAIVDEVDSILIDEARTPLIISQPGSDSTQKYMEYTQVVKNLEEDVHFNIDEKQRVTTLTEDGITKMEELLGVSNIYTDKGFNEVHHIEQALRAQAVYIRDVDYVVKDGEVIIVDEFTGRLMPGRRFGRGLHQAIEAKEGVTVQRESKTFATITFQNLFRLYDKLAGMTGTAITEEEEFRTIYSLNTVVIPTNRPIQRKDKADSIYKTRNGKFLAVAKIAKEKHAKGQPVLIGTTSIEKSELLSAALKNEGVSHNILNAKQHEAEAEIVAGAGQRGSVTIATNMAGRGTDIKLGEGVEDLGGLCILGTERHESRRIDNQLRGRAGRQGDLGETQFFVSMEDDLMRLFGGDKMKSIMDRLNVPEDMPIENIIVSRSIESAQKRVEGRNFDVRKHVVQYDDVMNKHREIMYSRRQQILEKIANWSSEETVDGPGVLHDEILESIAKEIEHLTNVHANSEDSEFWNTEEISESLSALSPQLQFDPQKLREQIDPTALQSSLVSTITAWYQAKCDKFEPVVSNRAEQLVSLQSIDMHWMEHIDDMTYLKEQVAFAGYAQKDPKIEYQDQGFQRFQQLLATIDTTIIRSLFKLDFTQFMTLENLQPKNDQAAMQTNESEINKELEETGAGYSGVARQNSTKQALQKTVKVGRNDTCPCGSGKKYKKCHGANT